MTFADTPDWQSGVYAPQLELGAFASTTVQQTITLPPNCETLILFNVGVNAAGFVTVRGVTTGVVYPTFTSPLQPTSSKNQIYYCPVFPATDEQVIVGWSGLSGNPWWAIADAGVRVTYDAILSGMLGVSGGIAPPGGIVVGGISSGDFEALATDASGHLFTVASYATTPHAANATFSFSGNGAFHTVGGNGIIIWDATLIDTGAGIVATRVGLGSGFLICQTSGAVADHFSSARGLFVAAGDTFSAAIAAAGTWNFSVNYDQL